MKQNDQRDDAAAEHDLADVDLMPVAPVPLHEPNAAPAAPAVAGTAPGDEAAAPPPPAGPPPTAGLPPPPQAAPTAASSESTLPAEASPSSADDPPALSATDEAGASGLSADALFEGVEVEGPPRWSEADVAGVAASIRRLDDSRERLVAAQRPAEGAEPDKAQVERALAEARAVLGQVADEIEQVSSREDATESRQQLVDAYFRLDRVLDKYRDKPTVGEEAAARSAAMAADKLLAQKVRKAAGKSKLKLGRGHKLLIALAIIILVRVALLFVGEAEEPKQVEIVRTAMPGGTGAHVQNVKPPTGQRAESSAPSIDGLGLVQSADGLVSTVFTVTRKNVNIETSYTWWENGEILTVEKTGKLPADRLKAGATYRVEVKVSDGQQSTTSVSEGVVFGPQKAAGR